MRPATYGKSISGTELYRSGKKRQLLPEHCPSIKVSEEISIALPENLGRILLKREFWNGLLPKTITSAKHALINLLLIIICFPIQQM